MNSKSLNGDTTGLRQQIQEKRKDNENGKSVNDKNIYEILCLCLCLDDVYSIHIIDSILSVFNGACASITLLEMLVLGVERR